MRSVVRAAERQLAGPHQQPNDKSEVLIAFLRGWGNGEPMRDESMKIDCCVGLQCGHELAHRLGDFRRVR
jgi:hypothetical protein